MKNQSHFLVGAILFLVAITLAVNMLAQGAPTPPSAAVQLRHEFYMQDFYRVGQDGKQMLAQHPNDVELRAWYVVGSVLSYQREGLDAVVKEMKQSAPASPWTLLATAAGDSLSRDLKTKLDLCEKAIAADKTNPDVLALAAYIVRGCMRASPDADALKKFFAEHQAGYEQSPDALAAEAQTLEIGATVEKDTKSTAALDLADQVLKRDPNNVAALLVKSQVLQKEQKFQASNDLLKTAARAVPDSYALHMAYWNAVLALPHAKPADEKQEIEADATEMFSSVPPSTFILQLALYKLDQDPLALGAEMGDLLLKKYPHTSVEDNVLFLRANKDMPFASDEQNLDHKVKALEAFLARPKHYDEGVVKWANWTLMYDLTSQKNPDLNRLYQMTVADGADWQARAITVLADHKSHLPEIEKLASEKLDAQWTSLQKTIQDAPESQVKARVQDFMGGPASWLAALGWVEFSEGHLDAALPKLETASKLIPQNPEMAVHLGRVYEAKNENAKAQKTFEDALSLPYMDEGDHPAVAALRDLYVHVHGSEAGLDAYMQPILAKDAARRKTVILSERLKPEKPIPSFELTSLNGKEVASGDLKGKLLVINFWDMG